MILSGRRVRQVRELQKLTQSALVREIPGLTQPQLSRIESDIAEVDAEVATQIAMLAGVTTDFLAVDPADGLVAQSPQFRSRSKLTKASRLRALQYAELVDEEYRRLLSQAQPLPLTFRALEDTRPDRAAAVVREWLGFGVSSPLPYLVLAVERLGVTVLGLPVEEDTLDAFCLWRGDQPVISILAGIPGDRVRFSVAHELGHLVLHRNDRRTGADVESEADEFAAELLTPRKHVEKMLPRSITLSSLTMVKSEWGVSIKSLIRRAREVGAIDSDRAISLYKQMSTRGWNKREPGYVPVEKPRAFRKLAEICYGPGPNVGRMASDAGWSESLTFDVLAQFAKPDELPHDRPPQRARVAEGDNVVDLEALRAARNLRSAEG